MLRLNWRNLFRRSAAILCVLTAAGTQGLAAAQPVPIATPIVRNDLTPNPTGKLAELADNVAHPQALTEWWYAHFMDPDSSRKLVIAIFGAPIPIVGAMMFYADGDRPVSLSGTVPVPIVVEPHGGAALDGLPGVRTDRGEISYDQHRQAYRVRISAAFEVDAWLDGSPLPGATGIIDLHNQGQWMGWTSQVATSTVTGSARMPGGATIDLTGWRGYHDHNWGDFLMIDQVADGWEWGVSHEPDGGASLVGGLVRRGGEWTGAVIDVRPWGTNICTSSTLDLEEWTYGDDYLSGATFALPGRITATCGPAEPYDFSKTFTLVEPVVADSGVLAASLEAPYRTVDGSFGMFEHIRSFVARAEQVHR